MKNHLYWKIKGVTYNDIWIYEKIIDENTK